VLLLTKDNRVGHLVLPQAFNQRIDSEVAVELVYALSDVFEARQNLIDLHGWKDLADVVNCVVDVCLALEGSRCCYVAHKTSELGRQEHTCLSFFAIQRRRQ